MTLETKTKAKEQLDELSKSTLKSYASSARKDAGEHTAMAKKFNSSSMAERARKRTLGARKAERKVAEETVVETAAADSLKPGSTSDAKSITNKSAVLASMIGAAHAMEDDSLTKWWTETLANSKTIGHGPGIPEGAEGKNKGSIKPHASMASHVKEAVKADLEKVLAEQEGLSDDFKNKAKTLFETALESRVLVEISRLEEEYQAAFEQEFDEVLLELENGIQEYLDYSATEWLKENKVEVESTLRNELAEDFLTGLKNLFVDNNINIPETQVDIVEEMAKKIDDLEGKLRDAIDEQTSLRDSLEASEKAEIVKTVGEGLTVIEKEKLQELSEAIDFTSTEEFKTKLSVIKESQFVKEPKKSVIKEGLEEVSETNGNTEKVYSSPEMKRLAEAITRTLR